MSKTRRDERHSKEHSSSSYTSSLSSDEEIDARDLKPIKEYLPNRKELARQLFKSVKPEKIRMMLPQVLKQMDLSELEQWCVSELSGMSKTRILSILNNKPMMESSDTSESDDSGPSLEIISDTEEWLTDDDASKKENDGKRKLKRAKAKVKGKSQINRANDLDKSNAKGKGNNKNENNHKDIKIKKEDDKDKEKEGDMLLDLLELEMRARAIRALIRKEEDILPSSDLQQTNDDQASLENNAKTPQDDAKAKENCRKQLERLINAKQANIGEDEDVVLVVQPTPVIELLSSDSDGEGHGRTRINKKLENECTVDKSTDNSREGKETREIAGANAAVKADSNIRGESRTIMPERNVGIKNNTLSISISASNVADKRKKSKKRSHSKAQLTSSIGNNEGSPKLKHINVVEAAEEPSSSNIKDQTINERSRASPTCDEKKVIVEEESAKEKVTKESRIEEERSADLDEIIDLDDYCDVMDIENCDDDKSQDETIVPSEQGKQAAPQATSSQPESSETWASRYYQTDDVQNVIKESKIQSEIRKRLRERQRLSKLNKSPNVNVSSQPIATVATETTPTGSVEEYLALKRATNTDISDNSNSNSNSIIQDNPVNVHSSEVSAKENLVQDESVTSREVCIDHLNIASNVNNAAVETADKVIDTQNDVQNDVENDIQTHTQNDTQNGTQNNTQNDTQNNAQNDTQNDTQNHTQNDVQSDIHNFNLNIT